MAECWSHTWLRNLPEVLPRPLWTGRWRSCTAVGQTIGSSFSQNNLRQQYLLFIIYNPASHEMGAKADVCDIKQLNVHFFLKYLHICSFFFSPASAFPSGCRRDSPQPAYVGILHNPFPECMSRSLPHKIFIRSQKYLHPAVKCRQIHTEYRKMAILMGERFP